MNCPITPSPPKKSDPETIDGFLHHMSEVFVTRKQNQLFEFVIQVGQNEYKSVSCWAPNKQPEIKEYAEKKVAIAVTITKSSSFSDFTLSPICEITEAQVQFPWKNFEDVTLVIS